MKIQKKYVDTFYQAPTYQTYLQLTNFSLKLESVFPPPVPEAFWLSGKLKR